MKEATDIQLYSLELGDHRFAVLAEQVKEIPDRRELSAITPIFHAPPSVRGYVNIRGEINLVVDLRRLFGLGDDSRSGDLIIFHDHIGPSFGIMVDHAGEILNVKADCVEKWNERLNNQELNAQSHYTSAVYKGKDELIAILAPERFLPQ